MRRARPLLTLSLLAACASPPDASTAKPAAVPSGVDGAGAEQTAPKGPPRPARGAGAVSGQPAPALALPDLESGETWVLADHLDPSGQSCPDAYMIAFMASWCGYCQQSLPTLRALEQQFPDLGIVTVTVDKTPATQKEELQKVRAAGLTGPVLVADATTASTWIGGSAIPRYVFINRDGKIIGQDRGFGDNVAPMMPGQARKALGQE